MNPDDLDLLKFGSAFLVSALGTAGLIKFLVRREFTRFDDLARRVEALEGARANLATVLAMEKCVERLQELERTKASREEIVQAIEKIERKLDGHGDARTSLHREVHAVDLKLTRLIGRLDRTFPEA